MGWMKQQVLDEEAAYDEWLAWQYHDPYADEPTCSRWLDEWDAHQADKHNDLPPEEQVCFGECNRGGYHISNNLRKDIILLLDDARGRLNLIMHTNDEIRRHVDIPHHRYSQQLRRYALDAHGVLDSIRLYLSLSSGLEHETRTPYSERREVRA